MKFNGFPEVWGSILSYISNSAILDTNIGWGWTGTAINGTSSNSTCSWGRTIHSSPDNSFRSTFFSRVVQSRNRNELFHRRRLEILWRLYNPSYEGHSRLIVCYNTWLYKSNQHRDFLVCDPNLPPAQ